MQHVFDIKSFYNKPILPSKGRWKQQGERGKYSSSPFLCQREREIVRRDLIRTILMQKLWGEGLAQELIITLKH